MTLPETETNSICPQSRSNHFQNKVIYHFTKVKIIHFILKSSLDFTFSRRASLSISFIIFMYKRSIQSVSHQNIVPQTFPGSLCTLPNTCVAYNLDPKYNLILVQLTFLMIKTRKFYKSNNLTYI